MDSDGFGCEVGLVLTLLEHQKEIRMVWGKKDARKGDGDGECSLAGAERH